MNEELVSLLHEARHEILELRKRNELISAQLAIVDIFAAVVGLRPSNAPMTVDIAWKLERAVSNLIDKGETH